VKLDLELKKLARVMWRDNIGGVLGFVLIFGGIFFFRGCGNIIQVYDPVTMKREDWTPFGQLMADRNPKHQAQAKMISEFYEVFPQKKRSPKTNQDVLEMADKYCQLKASASSEAQIFNSIAGQLQLLVAEPSAAKVVDELSLNLATVYALSNSYNCLNGIKISTSPKPKNYIAALEKQGFDAQDVDPQKVNANLLVAGYGACAEMYEMGFKQAVAKKIKDYSNGNNINVIYTNARQHLCSEVQ